MGEGEDIGGGGVLRLSVDFEAALLALVLRRSLKMAETDVRHLRCRNAKVLRPTIELSEREANKDTAAKAKAARNAKEQDCLLHRLSGKRCNSDSDLMDGSSFDDDAPTHARRLHDRGA